MSVRVKPTRFFVMRDTGSGAYIDGPFKTAAAARKRADCYRPDWSPAVVPGRNRDEAFRTFERRQGGGS